MIWKYYCYLMIACLLGSPALGQISIQGTLQSNTGAALPFANVLILHASDSTLASGKVSDLEGKFTITNVSAGEYLIVATMVGYQSYFNQLLVDGVEDIDYPTIQLTEESWTLDEIVVKAETPLYEMRADRMVVNVENSITSAGKTALEVLEKSPGVRVNRFGGGIQLNGKSGVQVMINGKISKMPMDAALQMLDGLNAANIEKIELITTPPAQYDAEGDAGIIHIVMKDNEEAGTTGTLGFNAGFNKAETAGANVSIGHRAERLNVYGTYSFQYDHNRHTWINNRFVDHNDIHQSVNTISERDPKTTVQNLRLEMDYDWSQKTQMNLSLSGYQRIWDMSANSTSVDDVKGSPRIITGINTQELNRWQSASGGLQLTHDFDDDHQLRVAVDRLFYHNHNPSDYINNTTQTDGSITEEIQVTKETPIQFVIGSLDYDRPVGESWTLSAGFKRTQSQFVNDVTVMDLEMDRWIINQRFSNSATLNEHINAVYLATSWKDDGKTIVRGGLRYEATKSDLESANAEESFERSFDNFFPSLLLSRSVGANTQLEFTYARRITRPSFNDMAPFVLFISPNTFFAGNPSLLPAITSSVGVGVQHLKYSASLRYAHTDNEIGVLQPHVVPEENEQIFQSQNLEYMRTWAFTSTIPLNLTSWWEVRSNISLYHQNYVGDALSGSAEGKLNRVSANVNSTIQLPKDFIVEVSGNYESGSLWGAVHFKPMGEIGLGIRKILPRSTITLNATDIFNMSVWRMESAIPGVGTKLDWQYYWNKRAINLTYSLTLGKGELIRPKNGSRASEARSRVIN
ncbi:outer membrane beta-barrel protein [Marinoscillum sp.]|uniref:outer membrane beta-barrel protein n=1 Tax=Marinoscillum sp. TaxID=2024838 RepID=UPI003BAB1BDB